MLIIFPELTLSRLWVLVIYHLQIPMLHTNSLRNKSTVILSLFLPPIHSPPSFCHSSKDIKLICLPLVPKITQKSGSRIPISIGKRVIQVQQTFASVYGYDLDDFKSSFDEYLEDEEEFMLGSLKFKVIPLGGHTPDSIGLLVGDSLFAGDSIFL